MKKESIESSLNRITAWSTVSHKNKVINNISSILSDNDNIKNIIEGFISSEQIDVNCVDLGGILVECDDKVVFISNSNNSNYSINNDEIQTLSTKKGYNYVNIQITTKKGSVLFKTFEKTDQLNIFIRSISRDKVEAISPSNHENEESKNFRILDLKGDPVFIFDEIKKISEILNDILNVDTYDNIKNLISRDILCLGTLAIFADDIPVNDELLVLYLINNIIKNGFNEQILKYKKAYNTTENDNTIDTEISAIIIEFCQTLTKKNIDNNIDLEGLIHLKKYDSENGTELSTTAASLYNRIAETIVKSDGQVTQREKSLLIKIASRISTIISSPLQDTIKPKDSNEKKTDAKKEDEETLESVMAKINELIGMQNIKDEINTLINLITVQKEREKRGLPVSNLSLHAVFYGPPGTGKTTIARLLGKVYKTLDLLTKGQLIETDRAGLVAGFVGQTAIKVDEVVNNALDGVLFIDEAYSLKQSGGGKDFGQEAIDTLLKRMEDYRDRFVVIVAGYPDEMKEFINSNPGFKSRFNRYFYFKDYTPDELINIFSIFIKKASLMMTDNAKDRLKQLFTTLYDKKDKTFGNGRLARNLFEKTIENQANRIAPLIPLTDEILSTIEENDIPVETDLEV